MHIDSLHLYHLSMPLVSPFETSFGVTTDRECILLSIRSEGLTGWGECAMDRDPGYSYETTGTGWHILKDFIAPLILGQDVPEAEDFQRRMEAIRGHHLAKAGVEMALWDLLGQRHRPAAGRYIGAGDNHLGHPGLQCPRDHFASIGGKVLEIQVAVRINPDQSSPACP